jgi:HEPN domain-containing protein
MVKSRSAPGSVADWLARANGDLALAKAPLPEGAFLEDLCFHAQQAAEKALKAVYCHRKLAFRYTHDLDELITGLRKSGLSMPDDVLEADELSAYAWESRYPGLSEPLTGEVYRNAVMLAERVLHWATQHIEAKE